jgi:hypothetical protein
MAMAHVRGGDSSIHPFAFRSPLAWRCPNQQLVSSYAPFDSESSASRTDWPLLRDQLRLPELRLPAENLAVPGDEAPAIPPHVDGSLSFSGGQLIGRLTDDSLTIPAHAEAGSTH